jgi:uncharacterized damage-inducible protein DinB
MRSLWPPLAAVVAGLVVAPPLSGQSSLPGFKEEFTGQFGSAARRLVALAEAMPADTYDWRPMEGVMSVATVYMHIARYNYLYPDQNLGVAAPVAYQGFEEEVTEKEDVVAALSASMQHVTDLVATMSDADLEAPARLYGRDVAKRAVLLQLVTHMNQHLGQSIAYARMNGVVPPWSR